MDELRNPFLDHTKDLLTNDSQYVKPRSVMESLGQIQERASTKSSSWNVF